ncbi:MAG TPA: hypothetical protein VGX03_36065 [Candidatus Binatia bacterium]|nr:hypothetical protein [Candidatus Binatia bacterium]
MITVWIAVALVAAVAIIAQKAYAQTATFTVFKRKVTLAAGGVLGFIVALDEPVNCKCTTNLSKVDAHGVGVLALTADNFPTAVGAVSPRISYTSIDHNGNQHAGVFCPPVASAVDGFLKDAGGNTCGGGTGLAAQTLVSPIGFATPSGGPHLVQCGGRQTGVFIETASSTNAASLRLHNHLTFAVPTRVTCEFMDLK